MDYEEMLRKGTVHSQMGFMSFNASEEVMILNEPELTSDTHKMEVKRTVSTNWQLGEFQLIQKVKNVWWVSF